MSMFNPEILRKITAELTQALIPVQKQFNIKICIPRTTYQADLFKSKLEVINLDLNGRVFDVNLIKAINNEIKKSLLSTEKNNNIKIKFGSTKYSSDKFTTSFEAQNLDPQVLQQSNEQKNILIKSLLNVDFQIGDKFKAPGGKEFIVENVNFKKKKAPVEIRCLQDNKLYAAPADHVDKLVKMLKQQIESQKSIEESKKSSKSKKR